MRLWRRRPDPHSPEAIIRRLTAFMRRDTTLPGMVRVRQKSIDGLFDAKAAWGFILIDWDGEFVIYVDWVPAAAEKLRQTFYPGLETDYAGSRILHGIEAYGAAWDDGATPLRRRYLAALVDMMEADAALDDGGTR